MLTYEGDSIKTEWDVRELKITTTAMAMSLNKRFNKENNGCACAL